ncbi:ABC transporter permease [Anaerobiospirillum succiniciproducens]|uniref:ABC transporter permease n=1 Tax=Anaerobiospirillum succiniciproducens TaxID=13335 RepID=UPI00235559F6|nr:ABC transporter permease [Anaerobiospirillum succiniciproducens]MCI6864009.1 ABC transporter permease [Anaerobiospirillum succiniciproducens]
MLLYLLKRLLMLIPVLFCVSVLVFLIMRVFSPDPALIVLGQHATTEAINAWRESMGFNEPLLTQYYNYMVAMFNGDFGTSFFTNTPVTTEIMARLPATIELAVLAIIIASIVGVIFGVISAVKKNSLIDNFTMTTALIGVSMPVFWLGMLLIILFSGILHWVPSGGRIDTLMRPYDGTGFYLYDTLIIGDFEAFFNALQHAALPAITLACYSMAIITRMTRSSMLDVLHQDYIRTAKAKGLPPVKVIGRHAFRNAFLPIITVIGLQFGGLLSGAVLTETVFSWPGIGAYSVESIMRSDFPVIQAVVLIVAFIFVFMNLVVDLLYAALDPRVKYGAEGQN